MYFRLKIVQANDFRNPKPVFKAAPDRRKDVAPSILRSTGSVSDMTDEYADLKVEVMMKLDMLT